MNQQVEIQCGTADRDGKRVVIAILGAKDARDKFDTDANFARSKFIEKVLAKFKLPGSAHEWLNDEIIRVADEQDETPASLWKLKSVVASEIVPSKVEWVMPGFIVKGAINDWQGDPGDGKSQAVASISARISRGIALPPANSPEKTYSPGNVAITNFEDDAERTIAPRLIAAGADMTRIHLIRDLVGFDETERQLSLPGDIPRMEEYIAAHNIVLWSIDPFTASLDKDINPNSDADIRRVTSLLSAAAERTGCAFVNIRHLNKKTGGSAMYRGGGSIAIIGAARSSVLIGRDPDDPDGRILASVKNNLCKPPASLRFHIETFGDTSRVVWGDECDLHANDLLDKTGKPASNSKFEIAKQIITNILTDGPRGEGEVVDACEDASVSRSTFWRARKALNVQSEKTGFGKTGEWLLSLPSTNGHYPEFDDREF